MTSRRAKDQGRPVPHESDPVPFSVREGFAKALALHQRGALADAARICEQVLSRDTDHFDALHLLGFIALQTGCPARAVELVSSAIQINQSVASAHRTLGVALRSLQHHQQALASLDRAIALRPNYAEAHYDRGLVLAQLQRYEDALACHDRAIALNPNLAVAHIDRGVVLHALARYEDALASYDRAITLRPDFAAAHFNRGVVLAELRRYQAALGSYDDAIALQPDFAQAHNNRGNALEQLNRRDEAFSSYDRAVSLDHGFAEALYNRGVMQGERLHHDKAIADYDAAIALKPDYVAAHWNKSLSLLALGRFEEGWSQFEWRKRLAVPVASHSYTQPLWLGKQPIAGKTLLIWSEQGLGDTIQFCRYAGVVRTRGARVILAVPSELLLLLKSLGPDLTVISDEDQPPAFDLHCPMMSLPLALGTTLKTIPSYPHYLHTQDGSRAQWATRLSALEGLKVGLVWAGGIRPDQPRLAMIDARRSISLAMYAPLAAVDGVSFVSLQKGPPASQTRMPPAGVVLHDWTAELEDFADTAALIMGLDLIVSVDTSVAHVAAALGKPVWLLNRFDTCWRWLLERTDSPWYPSMRLFRQPTMGDWTSVIEAVTCALRDRVGQARST